MIKGIPTEYKHYNFRSRLEAKWANFFDLLGWQWEYEPVDFNGWIPDFALYGENIVYVEIKPVITFPENVADKILKSGCENEVLILGQKTPIPFQQASPDCPVLGWVREGGYSSDYPITDSRNWWWEEAILSRWSAGNGQIGFCHAHGSFTDRISGGYDGGCIGNGEVTMQEIETIWAKACNNTQWKPR